MSSVDSKPEKKTASQSGETVAPSVMHHCWQEGDSVAAGVECVF